jgi:hypothetical protein
MRHVTLRGERLVLVSSGELSLSCRSSHIRDSQMDVVFNNNNICISSIQGVSEMRVLILIGERTGQFMKHFSITFLQKSITN